jgi:hypothetical protein
MKTIKDLFIGDFRISQKFGLNPQIYKQFGLKGHNGIDFATPNGTQLVCCFDEAEVITAEDDKTGYGKHIKLWDKKQNLCAIYGHCKELKVKVGEIVKFGNLIALSDNTGFSTGPHLHFGVCSVDKNCKRLNTNNGYAGWLDPFDKTVFTWKIEGIKEPLKNESAIIEEMTEEQKRILDFLKGKTEGDVREAFGALNDLSNYKEINNQLADKVLILGEEIEGLKDTISDLYKDLEKKSQEYNKLLEKYNVLHAQEQEKPETKPPLAEKDFTANYSWKEIAQLIIHKLFK